MRRDHTIVGIVGCPYAAISTQCGSRSRSVGARAKSSQAANGGARYLSAMSSNVRYGFPQGKTTQKIEQFRMVGMGRFELPTPRTPSECSTRLSHIPTVYGAGAPKG